MPLELNLPFILSQGSVCCAVKGHLLVHMYSSCICILLIYMGGCFCRVNVSILLKQVYSLTYLCNYALGSITTNKVSGGDGIPVKLFQILQDDAVKVLHSIYQQIWKTQQWPQDWKRSVFIPIPKKGNAKECSNYCKIAVISHSSKVMLKILQAASAIREL